MLLLKAPISLEDNSNYCCPGSNPSCAVLESIESVSVRIVNIPEGGWVGHIPFLQNGSYHLFGTVRCGAWSRSSPNTKYKIPRWNLGEFLNRPQASGHSDPLTPRVGSQWCPAEESASRVQSVEFRGPRVFASNHPCRPLPWEFPFVKNIFQPFMFKISCQKEVF